MVYHGTVRGGVVVLPPDTQLPEGIAVIVQPQTPLPNETRDIYTLRNGVPVFDRREPVTPVTIELVNQLRDELP